MATTVYAHLPGVTLAEGDAPLAGGRLTRLPFDEWAALESEYESASSKYTRSQPVFWIGELPTPAGDPTPAAVYAALWPLHMAFLLDPGAPLLPSPMLSTCYIRQDVSPEYADVVGEPVLRVIGPMERELIVYGSPLTYTYTPAHLAAVERRWQFIEANHLQDLTGDVAGGIDVIEETARPDSWYGGDLLICQLHGFVRCMAACESLLLPEIEEGDKVEITQTFGRHAALLFTASAERRDRAEKEFADLYRLRTQLIHGRTRPVGGGPDSSEELSEGRRLLRHVIMAALLLHARDSDRSPLSQVLHNCANNPDRQVHLAQVLTELPTL